MNDVLLTALLLADQAGDAASVQQILALAVSPEEAKALAEELSKPKTDNTGRDGDSAPSLPFQL